MRETLDVQPDRPTANSKHKKVKMRAIKGELEKVISQVWIERQNEIDEAAKVRQQLFQEIMNQSNNNNIMS